MDLTRSPQEEQFRTRVTTFLADQLPAGWEGYGALSPGDRASFLVEWRVLLREHRLLGVSWPVEYGGGGLGLAEQAVLVEEFARAGVPTHPHPNDTFGLNLIGPTLLALGTDDQRRRFLRPTLDGDIAWAQGYSEPEAGSDLFALRTRADRDGDELVLHGQKVWQTAGLTANRMFTLVRTDPDQPRSRGLSFVLLDLDQPGVDVRGIRTITGETEFSEVFLDGARARIDDVVGGLGAGARVALALLGFERGAVGLAAAVGHRIELGRLIALVRAQGLAADPLVRQDVVRCWTRVHQLYCLALTALTAGLRGDPPGPESSLVKLLTAEHHQTVTDLAMRVLGPAVLAPTGPRAAEWLRPQPLGTPPDSAAPWTDDYLNARARTIYGGSSEIQRDTIATRILGLPPARGA
ncbi:MAG: acyl-CoA dehydrogenase [Pseudonocardia sp. SCN 73-27]|uniref:acyl-CoA dehydrogenase family protein n=1 Tax=Pseudonocardia sp. SCN 73-27 TaxID=1660132 RepID=UPI00086E72FA|nr:MULTISPECIES: acyl-CoA dehydrogenase family protein [unclassified Pseudonocardia]ODU26462.1 MAG: acyl-CoA dehydrogenase [Pseudonocardia sp. SCN 72-51]ODU98156.1 MAG: acyl-CoA dehydrogenase [Pseudonocardia sp. SCN 73-27]